MIRIVAEIQVADEDEATEFMIYHLKMAAAYFEGMREDQGCHANEVIKTQMSSEEWINAASAFIDVLCTGYKEME